MSGSMLETFKEAS